MQETNEQTMGWDTKYDFQLYSDGCPSPNIHEYKKGQVSTRYSTTMEDLTESLKSFNLSSTTNKLNFGPDTPPK